MRKPWDMTPHRVEVLARPLLAFEQAQHRGAVWADLDNLRTAKRLGQKLQATRARKPALHRVLVQREGLRVLLVDTTWPDHVPMYEFLVRTAPQPPSG